MKEFVIANTTSSISSRVGLHQSSVRISVDNNAKKARSRLRCKNTSVKIFKPTDQANNMDVTDVMVEIYPIRHANLTPIYLMSYIARDVHGIAMK